jgi:hypothetical protein
MSTRASNSRVPTVLSFSAALLTAALGVWLLQQAEASLRIAGVLALAAAALSVASALLGRRAPASASTPVAAPASVPAVPLVLNTPAIDPVAVADGGALRLLTKLQEQGRLLDFAMEDIGTVSDAQVAAVARVVHSGCRATLQSAFDLKPLHAANEGALVTLEAGFDPEAHRLLGKVTGTPPFKGTLLHRGWRTTAVKLPHATDPAKPHTGIVAPAEIELR